MTEFPGLEYLMGAYLHQDWGLDHDTVWDVVDHLVSAEQPSVVDELRDDVRRLVAEHRSEEELKTLLLDELDSYYWVYGDNSTFTEWLAELDQRLNGPAAR